MEFVYRAKIVTDPDGGFIGTFPDVAEAITHGETKGQVLDNAADALAVAVLGRIKDGADLPEPKAKARALVAVALPAQAAAKAALYEAWRAAGIAKTELAQRLGKSEGEVRRMLDPHHATKLPALEAALKALGKTIIISTTTDGRPTRDAA